MPGSASLPFPCFDTLPAFVFWRARGARATQFAHPGRDYSSMAYPGCHSRDRWTRRPWGGHGWETLCGYRWCLAGRRASGLRPAEGGNRSPSEDAGGVLFRAEDHQGCAGGGCVLWTEFGSEGLEFGPP
eukprot:5799723-Pleurochrysis_carterae.AAC.1